MVSNDRSAKHLAFTLAEVLITLGIIGVVAAMTIPTLITNAQKKETVTRLKGAYSQIEQAIRMSEADNGDLSGWDFTKDDWFETYIVNYIKYQKDTFKDLSDKKAIPYKEISGNRETGLALLRPGFGGSKVYTLLNGVDIITGGDDHSEESYSRGLLVDINGIYSKPNQFGKDTFYLLVDQRHGLAPRGKWAAKVGCAPTVDNPDRNWYKNSTCWNLGCNKNGRGMFCAGLIMYDNWTIARDYPWK